MCSSDLSNISVGSIAFRYKPAGHIYDGVGPSIFSKESDLDYLQAALNSSSILSISSILSPTLTFEVGQVASYPVIVDEDNRPRVASLVGELRHESKEDWDSQETSWDFRRNPMV